MAILQCHSSVDWPVAIGLLTAKKVRRVLRSPTQAEERLDPDFLPRCVRRSVYAPFIKETRMECINATSLSRKSGQWGTQLRKEKQQIPPLRLPGFPV